MIEMCNELADIYIKIILVFLIQVVLSIKSFGFTEIDTLSFKRFRNFDPVALRHFNAITEDKKGNIYLGGIWGPGLIKFDGLKFKVYEPDISNKSSIRHSSIHNLFTKDNGDIMACTSTGVDIFDPETESFTRLIDREPKNWHNPSNLENPIVETSSHIWIASNNELHSIKKESDEAIHFQIDSNFTNSNFSVYQMVRAPWNYNILWLGTENGLYKFDITSGKAEKIKGINESIYGICIDSDGLIYLNPKGKSSLIIYELKKNGKLLEVELSREKALQVHFEEYSYFSYPMNDSTLLVSTNYGVAKMNKNTYQFDYLAHSSEVDSLMLPSRVRLIYKDRRGYLWLPTFNGIVRTTQPIDAELQRDYIPSLNLEQVLVDDTYHQFYQNQNYTFSSDVESLSFIFNMINPSSQDLVKYQFRYNDKDDWIDLTSGTIRLDNIKPGTNFLEVRAMDAGLNDNWSEIEKINFYRDPALLEKLWFKILILLSVLTVVGIYYFNKNHQANNERRLRQKFTRRLAEVEMEALKAQMNPHFLFNTMNSINHFILKNEADEASSYLTKFSRLVRQTLNNSREKMILIEEEVGVLKLYLELEQLRFQNKFDFEIIVDDESTMYAFIPPMLIQPYVENAIWHGLMHKDGKGNIKISFGKVDDMLVISIKDDGVGRQKAMEYQSKYRTKKKSLGMKITDNRLKLVKQIYNLDADVEIIDLMENEKPSGTEVVLNIPFQVTK